MANSFGYDYRIPLNKQGRVVAITLQEAGM